MEAHHNLGAIEQLEADEQFIYRNWDELVRNYSGKIVGIYHGGIIAVAESFGELTQLLLAKKITPSHVAKQFMNPSPDFAAQVKNKVQSP